MTLLVTGGRSYSNREVIRETLDSVHAKRPISVLIHGDARGADTLCKEWAEVSGIPTKAFPADWEKNGRAAGPIRNAQMLKEGKPEFCVVFPGGEGTADMTRKVLKAKIGFRLVIDHSPWPPLQAGGGG